VRISIREKHFGRGLLDERAADGTCEHIARALSGESHHPIQLPPGLRSVLGKVLKGGIGEEAPELVHPTHELPAIQELPDQVKEVERDRRTAQRMIQEVRDVEANEGVL
jgi:hypothetical protein